MLYRILKILIGLGIKLYYREIKVIHPERLNVKGAKIIIANHPNTLIDAWIIAFICKEPIYYMTKGTFFGTRLKRWILGSLGMIPINRSVDGRTSGVSNTDSFEMCYRVLEQGKTLVVFPEGNSEQERLLRNLKSGTARIALQTELRNKGKLGLQIIPLGLVYSQAEKFRSSALVKVGKTIDPIPYLNEFEEDSLKAAKKLTNVFKASLVELLVDSESKEQDVLTDQIVEVLSIQSLGKKQVEEDVALMKEVYQSLNEIQRSDINKLDEIQSLTKKISWQINQLEVKSYFFDRKYRSWMFVRQSIQSILALLIGLPIFIYGLLHNVVPFKLTDLGLPKIVKDVEYYAPMAVLFGLILYPLNYTGWLYLTGSFIEIELWMKFVYFLSMPLSGMFAYSFLQYYKHVAYKLRFIVLMKTKKSVINSIKDDRDRLKCLLFGNECI